MSIRYDGISMDAGFVPQGTPTTFVEFGEHGFVGPKRDNQCWKQNTRVLIGCDDLMLREIQLKVFIEKVWSDEGWTRFSIETDGAHPIPYLKGKDESYHVSII